MKQYAQWDKERNAYRIYDPKNPNVTLGYADSAREAKQRAADEDSELIVEKRLFVDMDGTLAVFRSVDTMETLYEEGYFANLEPQPDVIDAIAELHGREGFEVYILSAYLSDSKYALAEKNAWLNKYLPFIDDAHRLFVQCGTDKTTVVPGGIGREDYLLDDYTANLLAWDPPGHGIKLLNGINHTKGTWKKDMIRHEQDSDVLAGKIASVTFGRHVYDDKSRTERDEISR